MFTHNIRFAAQLLAKADRKKWRYYDIRSEGADSGVLSCANHPRVNTIAQVSNRVKTMIEGAKKADGEIKSALVEKGYEELRGLCERIGHPRWIPELGMIIPKMARRTKSSTPDVPLTGLASVLFTPVQQRVLGLLFGQPERRF